MGATIAVAMDAGLAEFGDAAGAVVLEAGRLYPLARPGLGVDL